MTSCTGTWCSALSLDGGDRRDLSHHRRIFQHRRFRDLRGQAALAPAPQFGLKECYNVLYHAQVVVGCVPRGAADIPRPPFSLRDNPVYQLVKAIARLRTGDFVWREGSTGNYLIDRHSVLTGAAMRE